MILNSINNIKIKGVKSMEEGKAVQNKLKLNEFQNKLAEIEDFLARFDENDYFFSNQDKFYFTLKKTAEDVGIDNLGNETLQRSFAYFHYQYFQDIDRIKDLLGLVSPTATLHYMGYEDDRYLCFYCNRGCIYRKKYK